MTTRSFFSRLWGGRALASALLLALLAGCSSTRTIDSSVQQFSYLSNVPQSAWTYRFERLPSQQTPLTMAPQTQLELIAQTSLAKVGMQQVAADAHYSVQVGLSTTSYLRPNGGYWGDDGWGGPGWRYGGGFGWGGGWDGWGPGWGPGFGGFPPTRIYRHEVGLVMRDTRTQQVVYETHAANDDLWDNDPVGLGAMFDAALQGFPQALGSADSGPRNVNITVPR